MVEFTGFFAAVAMDLFFDPVNPTAPGGFLWSNTIVAEKRVFDGLSSVQIVGWPLSAASPNTLAAFYVVEGKISTPAVGNSLVKMTGTLSSIYEYRRTNQGGAELFWQVYFAEGKKASELLSSPSLGKSMQLAFSGDDVIRGSTSNDTLYGFRGDDKLIGGTGNDFYWVDSQGDKAIEADAEGEDTLAAFFNYDGSGSKQNIERWYCTNKCTTLSANSKNNFVIGSELKNKLNGYGGRDLVYGTAIHPLTPEKSLRPDQIAEVKILEADQLDGGSGNDLIFGFGGKDKLKGGSGADIFVFDTPPTNSAAAKITDFNSNEDRIALSWDRAYDQLTYKLIRGFSTTIRADYYPNAPATELRYTKIQPSEFTVISNDNELTAINALHRIIYNKKNGKVFYDKDGSGKSVARLIATLAKNPQFTAQNVLLVAEAGAFEGVYEK